MANVANPGFARVLDTNRFTQTQVANEGAQQELIQDKITKLAKEQQEYLNNINKDISKVRFDTTGQLRQAKDQIQSEAVRIFREEGLNPTTFSKVKAMGDELGNLIAKGEGQTKLIEGMSRFINQTAQVGLNRDKSRERLQEYINTPISDREEIPGDILVREEEVNPMKMMSNIAKEIRNLGSKKAMKNAYMKTDQGKTAFQAGLGTLWGNDAEFEQVVDASIAEQNRIKARSRSGTSPDAKATVFTSGARADLKHADDPAVAKAFVKSIEEENADGGSPFYMGDQKVVADKSYYASAGKVTILTKVPAYDDKGALTSVSFNTDKFLGYHEVNGNMYMSVSKMVKPGGLMGERGQYKTFIVPLQGDALAAEQNTRPSILSLFSQARNYKQIAAENEELEIQDAEVQSAIEELATD